jgi:hypothetical protein
MMDEWVPLVLTVPQARFATDHDATPGARAKIGGGVYLYHEESGSGSSFRWLVGPDGEVLETEVFTESR